MYGVRKCLVALWKSWQSQVMTSSTWRLSVNTENTAFRSLKFDYRPSPSGRDFVHYDFLKLHYISHKMRRICKPSESDNIIVYQQHYIRCPKIVNKSFSANIKVFFFTLVDMLHVLAVYALISVKASVYQISINFCYTHYLILHTLYFRSAASKYEYLYL